MNEQEVKELKENQEEIKKLIKEVKKELRGLIEIQQRLIHERLGVAPPPPPKEYGEPEGKKIRNIEIINWINGRIAIQGNTYDYNSAIKTAATENDEKAKWEPTQKLWHMSEKCLNNLIENLRSLDLEEGKDFEVKVTQTIKNQDGFGDGL